MIFGESGLRAGKADLPCTHTMDRNVESGFLLLDQFDAAVLAPAVFGIV